MHMTNVLDQLPPQFGWIAVLGAVVGYASGLFGVGGGFILTPLLITVFHIEPAIAIGSDLAQLVIVGAGAGWRHAAKGFADFRLVGYMSPGLVLGTWLGKQCLHWLTTLGTLAIAGQRIPVATVALLVLFILLLLLVAFRLWRDKDVDGATGTSLAWAQGPWRVRIPSSQATDISLAPLLGTGLFIGVMAGLLGIGGGVVLIPLLVYGFGVQLRMAIGTSALLILVSAIAGVVQYALAGQINGWLVLALLIGSTPLVQIGAWHSHRIHAVHLQRSFAILVFLVACFLFGHLFWH